MGALSLIELDTPPDDFLQNEPEGAAFHKAFLASGINGFKCGYLSISRDALRVTVVPFFTGTFSLTTLLPDGLLKKSLSWIKFRYVCIGHPSTDFGLIEGEISAEILALVNATLTKKAPLIAYKGFPNTLPLDGFNCARGWPVSILTIKGDYYTQLDGHRRTDFRHKLEKAQTLRVELYKQLPESLVLPIYELYLNTYHHAPTRFERLTADYFRHTATLSQYLLFFEADTLIGFVQIIGKNKKATFSYIGMDYQRNQQYGLYYVICLRSIEFCTREGYQQIELGVSSYHFKQLLGGQLTETHLYYQHKKTFINKLLGKLKFLLEPSAYELR